MPDHEQNLFAELNSLIIERPATVVVLFLVATIFFSVGLGLVTTEAGTEEFAQDIPEFNAFQDIQDEFGTHPFAPEQGSTSLIQRRENVLSKKGVLRMLEAQRKVEQNPSTRTIETGGVAKSIAHQLNPTADTWAEIIDAVEQSSDSEVRDAARRLLEAHPALHSSLSEDLNLEEPSASATIATVTHRVPAGIGELSGQDAEDPTAPLQRHTARIVDSVGGDIIVFGSGVISDEFQQIIGDSLQLVLPAALILIILFLVYAYRDPFDLLLGIIALFMTLIWTFGFIGYIGIPFTQMMIAIPPLLLAVGIDFGIHVVNRYREEKIEGFGIDDSMAISMNQLMMAFFLVMLTTVVGFGSNLISSLKPIRDFGLVAAFGIFFVFLIFGLFLPASKVLIDRMRKDTSIPAFGTKPIGFSNSAVSGSLSIGIRIARTAPFVFVIAMLIFTMGMASTATDIDTTFSNEDFLPPEETPGYLDYVPGPLQPGEYTVTETTNFLEENFRQAEMNSVTLLIEAPLKQDNSLELLSRGSDNPPDSFIEENRKAQSDSILDVIQSYRSRSDDFDDLVNQNDVSGNGIPDRNLAVIYNELMNSPFEEETKRFLAEDYRSMRAIYQVKSDAEQTDIVSDAWLLADKQRLKATPTGEVVVMQAISDEIASSAFNAMSIALILTAILLILMYAVLEGRPFMGFVNIFPIATSVAMIAATMWYLEIPFNAITGTILAISIGLGVDYSVHMVHRFTDEYNDGQNLFPAIERTVQGTGGALTGSMLTTVSGVGALLLAITPILGQFGFLMGISIFYAYLTSIFMLPSALVVWERYAT